MPVVQERAIRAAVTSLGTIGPVQSLFAEFLIGDLSAAYFSGAARDREHLTSCRAPSPASVRRQHQREFS
jgi:hypothetical protein